MLETIERKLPPIRNGKDPLRGVFQEHMTDLDADCEGRLPDELYASLVLEGATEQYKKLALRAADAGFDFHAWEWNRKSPERNEARLDLATRFADGVAPGTKGYIKACEDADYVMAMCDLAGYGERFRDAGRTDIYALAYDRMEYPVKVDMLMAKMKVWADMPEDKYIELQEAGIREMMGWDLEGKRVYLHADADAAKAAARVVGLGGNQDVETFLTACGLDADNMASKDGLLERYVRGYRALCSARCTSDMLSSLACSFDPETIHEKVLGVETKGESESEAALAERNKRRELAYCWYTYGADRAFLNSEERRNCHGDELRAALDYARHEEMGHLVEMVDYGRSHSLDMSAVRTAVPGRVADSVRDYEALSEERAAQMGDVAVSELARQAQEDSELSGG